MRPLYLYPFQLTIVLAVLSLVSCVSTGKFKDMQQQAQKNDSLYTWSMHTLKTCQDNNDNLNKQKVSLQNQLTSENNLLTASNENNTQLRRQLQDLSAISSSQAESIRNSLDNMSAKDTYLQDLRLALAHRDSVNLAVLMDLKMVLGSFEDRGVNIKLEKGTVSIDLSDSLLFSSDSNGYTLTAKGKSVVGRLARVFGDHSDLEFMVEGHTDSIPNPQSNPKDSVSTAHDSVSAAHDSTSSPQNSTSSPQNSISSPQDSLSALRALFADNWDLSIKRAVAIVRLLQNNYNITPVRMTAAGRNNPDRSTRVVIFPQLDPLLRVLEHRQGKSAPAGQASQ
jgi:chemotaxis protein MotB